MSVVEQVFTTIKGMNLVEINELANKLQEEFGVSAVMAAPIAAGATAQPQAAAAEEEKTEFDVVITSVGDNKIPVIKVVRQVTDLVLKDAKSLVESVPAVLKTNIPKAEAEKIKGMLEEVGAGVEIR